MKITTTTKVEFSDEEKDLLDKMFALAKEAGGNSRYCNKMSCSMCPFDGFCGHKYSNAAELEVYVNETLNE